MEATVASIVASLGVLSGVAIAWVRSHRDGKDGIDRKAESVRVDWVQFNTELRQLNTEVRELLDDERAARNRLEGRVSELAASVERLRTSYWRAVQHIRELRSYIKKHTPEDAPAMPEAPPSLLDDL